MPFLTNLHRAQITNKLCSCCPTDSLSFLKIQHFSVGKSEIYRIFYQYFSKHFLHSSLVSDSIIQCLKKLYVRNFSKIFYVKNTKQLFFATPICNKDHNAASVLDNSCRANKPMFRAHFSNDSNVDRLLCSECIFSTILVPTN